MSVSNPPGHVLPQSKSWDLHYNAVAHFNSTRSCHLSLVSIQVPILAIHCHPGHVSPQTTSRDWCRIQPPPRPQYWHLISIHVHIWASQPHSGHISPPSRPREFHFTTINININIWYSLKFHLYGDSSRCVIYNWLVPKSIILWWTFK